MPVSQSTRIKPISWLVFAVIALIAGFLIVSKSTYGVVERSGSGAAPAAPSSALFTGSTAAHPVQSAPLVFEAKTYRALAEQLSQSSLAEGERIFLASQAALFCDSLSMNGRRTASKQATGSEKVSSEFGATFCKDYREGEWAALRTSILQLPPSDPVVDAYTVASVLYDGVAAGGPNGKRESEAAAAHLAEVMLTPNMGSAAVVAAEALQQVSFVPPRVKELAESHSWSLSDAELAEAQLIAAMRGNCEVRGGCGPLEVVTMQLCSTQRTCEPGATAESVWRKTNSPQLIEAANAIRILKLPAGKAPDQ